MSEGKYFSKEAVLEAIIEKGQSSRRYKLGEIWELNFKEIREALDDVPAADVRPVVRGSWEWEMYQMTPHCSVCGEKGKPGPAIEKRFPFCPWCGADMRNANIEDFRRIKEQLKEVQEE